jgi:phosphatidylserine decarboxylase
MAGEVTDQGCIVFLEADNPNIDVVYFIGIGMSKVSTCEITVKEGRNLRRGSKLVFYAKVD